MRIVAGIVAGVAACFSFAATSVAATTKIPSGVSGVYCEGAPAFGPVPAGGMTLGDVSGDPRRTAPQVAGDVAIFGAVKHRDPRRDTDGWTMAFGDDSDDLTVSYANTTPSFDGKLWVNGAAIDFDGAGTISFPGMSGTVVMVVDPIAGRFGAGEVGTWNLRAERSDLASVAAVPLPAGGLLLVAGLAAFAAVRRRRSF